MIDMFSVDFVVESGHPSSVDIPVSTILPCLCSNSFTLDTQPNVRCAVQCVKGGTVLT